MAKMIWRPPSGENANDGQSVTEGEQRYIATMAIAGKDDKLEINCDGAWFAAELTLRDDGTTHVHFDDFSDADEDWDVEKIKNFKPIHEHIRVVSEQLQDQECSIASLNNMVCALRKAEDMEGWYDAVVTEVRKRPHKFRAEGEICTCLFTVLWREGPAKGQTERNLTCGQVCIPSTKNVETHPLILDILCCASGEGRGTHDDEEGPSSSAPRERRKKGNSDDDTECSEEHVYAHRCKRFKPEVSTISQAKAKETFVEPPDPLELLELATDDHFAGTTSSKLFREIGLSSASTELVNEITAEILAGVNLKHSEEAVEETKAQDVPLLHSPSADESNTPKKRMRGQAEREYSFSSDLITLRERIFGVKSSEEACKDQVKVEEFVFTNAKAENEKAKAEAYVTQRKTEILAAKCEAQRSKKVRITVEFDMDLGESASVIEGVPFNRSFPAGAKVTSYTRDFEEELVDSGGKSEQMPNACKPAESQTDVTPSDLRARPTPERKDGKFLVSSVKSEKLLTSREEKLPGLCDGSCGGQKTTDLSVQPKVEDGSKVGHFSRCRIRPGKEKELVDLKSHTRLGSAAENTICLSDEEDDGAGSSIAPASSTRGFAKGSRSSGSDHPFIEDREEFLDVHLQNNGAKRRSAFIKSVLTKAGCVLMIDNLDVGVRESDLRELFLKFCDKAKIQSVTIPPHHPEVNRALGYVIFADKAAADAAAGYLDSRIIVAARGRPWVVKRQDQEEPVFGRKSDLVGDMQDGNAVSTEKFKVLTMRLVSEYNAARERLRVYEEHRKQTRVLFQRHYQEEKKLDANPELR